MDGSIIIIIFTYYINLYNIMLINIIFFIRLLCKIFNKSVNNIKQEINNIYTYLLIKIHILLLSPFLFIWHMFYIFKTFFLEEHYI
jgi:hypothetical protein